MGVYKRKTFFTDPPQGQVRVERARLWAETRCHDAALDRCGEFLEGLRGPDIENYSEWAALGGEASGAAELEEEWAQRCGLFPNTAGKVGDVPAIDVSQKAQRHVEGFLPHPANRVATWACAQLVGGPCGRAARALVEINRKKSANRAACFIQGRTPRESGALQQPSLAHPLRSRSPLRPRRADELHAQQRSPDPVEGDLRGQEPVAGAIHPEDERVGEDCM